MVFAIVKVKFGVYLANNNSMYCLEIYIVHVTKREVSSSCVQKSILTMRVGFEPTRAEHNGLAVHRLNHSATSSCYMSVVDMHVHPTGIHLQFINFTKICSCTSALVILFLCHSLYVNFISQWIIYIQPASPIIHTSVLFLQLYT